MKPEDESLGPSIDQSDRWSLDHGAGLMIDRAGAFTKHSSLSPVFVSLDVQMDRLPGQHAVGYAVSLMKRAKLDRPTAPAQARQPLS